MRAGGLFRIPVAMIIAVVLMMVGSAAPAAAAAGVGAAPAWSIHSVAKPVSFSTTHEANCEEHPYTLDVCNGYVLVPVNVGARVSEGPITVVDTLPAGLTTIRTPEGANEYMEWACEADRTATPEVITCRSEFYGSPEGVPALTPAAAINVEVAVASSARGPLVNRVEIAGGGAASPAGAESVSSVEAEPAPFGVLDGSFADAALTGSGAPDSAAASHPAGLTTAFAFPSEFSIQVPGTAPRALPVAEVKQIVVDLPPGLLGDALAAPTCSLSTVADLNEEQRQCPAASRVGKLALIEPGGAQTEVVLFNVTPERGRTAEFAAYAPDLQRAELLYATVVGSGASTHIRVTSAPQDSVVRDVGVVLTFFGDPNVIDESSLPPAAFFTNPSDCSATGFASSIHVDSWQDPGRTEPDGQPDFSDPNWKSATFVSPPVAGCGLLHFQPSLSLAPEAGHAQADEPAGYEATLRVPQNEDPNGLATPPLKSTVVALPPGVAISPAAANGLAGCQEAGTDGIELDSPEPGHCPAASTVGDVEVVTPLLKEVLKGNVFVAQPTCGGPGQPTCSEEAAETGGVFGLYLEVGSENAGIHLKFKGKVEVGGNGHHNDLAPGQVRTTFAETPQDPFSELKLNFNAGPRAPLANPQGCGTFSSTAELEPWSHQPAPGEAAGTPNAILDPLFTISAGCGGGFAPAFSAGTVNPQAAAFSPFTLTFSRHDGEQDLSGVTVDMPRGLLGKIAGLQRCPEPAANAGTCGSMAPGSRIGAATAAAGSGTDPFWQTGNVYLTGPYNSGPFGLSVVVPAVAGPYNLGNIVVRASIRINPDTAQVTVVSDPLPQSVDGVPLRVKTVNVTVGDQAAFTFNPSSCQPAQVAATIASAQGASVPVASRFQAANCQGLSFKPVFTASTLGKTSKANGASLKVKIASAGIGQANIAKVDLTIPAILPTRLTTIQKACTEAQFNANPAGCPPASNIATATVHTPLLNSPLTGPVYFVSHGGAAFPDTEIVLQGEGVRLILDGHTKITKGVTYSRFESVPDAPFTSFEFNAHEGPYSIFGANGNLCETEVRMPTTLVAQNGAVLTKSTLVEPEGCPYKLTILSHKVNKRTLTLKVAVPAAGKLTVSGKGLAKATKTAKGHSTLTLTLKAKGHGKLTTKVKLNFTPANGRKLAATVPAKFKR